MDFVVGLPKTLGKFYYIWIVVGMFPKLGHFILGRVVNNVEQMSKMYVEEIVRLHGVPLSIISDRATLFNSNF